MSQVGAGGGGEDKRGGGRDDRFKQKVDEQLLQPDGEGDSDEDDDDNVGYGVEADISGGAGPNAQAHLPSQPETGAGVRYRGVRRYAAGDGSYRTTYVSCINSRDSPHNNRQIWLGRYYDARAAAMAYDVFSCFNHHEALINFPELLHIYTRFVPRRGIAADGTFLPITASDLERIKHIGLGVVRAFFPDSCAAIHTRRNQKALPASTLPLSAHQRQTAAALQATYHSQIEERTRTQVLIFLAAQRAFSGAAAATGFPATAAAQPSSSILSLAPSISNPQPAQRPSLLDFSSILIPTSSQSGRSGRFADVDLPALQAPQYALPRAGEPRQAPTSPDTLRELSSREQAESAHTPSRPFSALSQSWYGSPQEALYDASASSSTPSQSHMSRPDPVNAQSSPESASLRAVGASPATLIRPNVESSTRPEPPRRVSFDDNRGTSSLPYVRTTADISPFPLVQKLNELSGAPSFGFIQGSEQERQAEITRRVAPLARRTSDPAPMPHPQDRSPIEGFRQERQGSFSYLNSYRPKRMQYDHPSSHEINPQTFPVNPPQFYQPQFGPDRQLQAQASSLPTDQEQRVVPLHRQSPQELPLFHVFERQASALGGATNIAGPPQPPPAALDSTRAAESGAPTSAIQNEGIQPSTKLTLGAEFINPAPRPPILPDLNERPSMGTTINVEELQRVSTLGLPRNRSGASHDPPHDQHGQSDQRVTDETNKEDQQKKDAVS
ncbi:hypothetical protein KP509_1Z012000 [Ceratopteris richardii]|nr:hypothetical protein KP509_1Z012000 [Ceratopteris richardii]